MDLASKLLANARLPWRGERRLSSLAIVRGLWALGIASLSAWFYWSLSREILQLGFMSQSAAGLWDRFLIVRDTTQFSPEYITLLFPPIPFGLTALFSSVPGLQNGATPYLVSVLAVALLLTRIFLHLIRRHGLPFAVLFTCLLGLNPAMIWVATTGGNGALGALVFYGLISVVTRLKLANDPSAYMRFGYLLCLLFFVDERALYIALAIFPLLPLVMPERPLNLSPHSVYLVLFSPFVFGVLSWMYLNWLFMHDSLSFLTSADGLLRGAYADAEANPWLRDYGGQFLVALLAMPVGLLCVFPAWALLPKMALRHGKFTIGLVASLTIVMAGAFGNMTQFIAHPLDIVVFGSVALVIGVREIPLSAGRRRSVQILMAVGVCSGWLIFFFRPAPEMLSWRAAIAGREVDAVQPEQIALGRFLAERPGETMLDDRAAPYAIAARGNARDLILPYSQAFKLALASTPARVRQFAVSKPGSATALKDRLTQRFPKLYGKGLPGYAVVFDEGDWRVWRKVS